LVPGGLIRLEAVNGSVALAAVVGAAISSSIVAVAGASTRVAAMLMSGSSSMMMRDLRLFVGVRFPRLPLLFLFISQQEHTATEQQQALTAH
jgi:hypothetical protein